MRRTGNAPALIPSKKTREFQLYNESRRMEHREDELCGKFSAQHRKQMQKYDEEFEWKKAEKEFQEI